MKYEDLIKKGADALMDLKDDEPPAGVDVEDDEAMAQFIARVILGAIGLKRETRQRGLADAQYRFVTEWQ